MMYVPFKMLYRVVCLFSLLKKALVIGCKPDKHINLPISGYDISLVGCLLNVSH